MYDWRKMSAAEREFALTKRKAQQLPWHSPPHLDFPGVHQYLMSAACYEHAPIIGKDPDRMTKCESDLLEIFGEFCISTYAWCILPNHYHALIKTERIKELRKQLGLFNGRSSYRWNGEDNARGRKVWFNCFERKIKSQRHFWATMNYIHNNPVHHGYVKNWLDWPWSSARQFLEEVGRERAIELWKEYPILNYGEKWDKQ